MKREDIEKNFNKGRSNLFLVVLLTSVNVVLRLTNTDISFLFAANLPSFFIDIGKYLSEESGNQILFNIGVLLAFAGIAIYGLCYVLSKKYNAWLLVALVIFPIDTLFLLFLLTLDFNFGGIIGIGFHAWVIYNLACGVKAWSDLKKLPVNELPEENNTNIEENL